MGLFSKKRTVVIGGLRLNLHIKNGEIKKTELYGQSFKSFESIRFDRDFVEFLEKKKNDEVVNLDNPLLKKQLKEEVIDEQILKISKEMVRYLEKFKDKKNKEAVSQLLETGLLSERDVEDAVRMLNRPIGLKGFMYNFTKGIATVISNYTKNFRGEVYNKNKYQDNYLDARKAEPKESIQTQITPISKEEIVAAKNVEEKKVDEVSTVNTENLNETSQTIENKELNEKVEKIENNIKELSKTDIEILSILDTLKPFLEEKLKELTQTQNKIDGISQTSGERSSTKKTTKKVTADNKESNVKENTKKNGSNTSQTITLKDYVAVHVYEKMFKEHNELNPDNQCTKEDKKTIDLKQRDLYEEVKNGNKQLQDAKKEIYVFAKTLVLNKGGVVAKPNKAEIKKEELPNSVKNNTPKKNILTDEEAAAMNLAYFDEAPTAGDFYDGFIEVVNNSDLGKEVKEFADATASQKDPLVKG